jgi:hypothetical protein
MKDGRRDMKDGRRDMKGWWTGREGRGGWDVMYSGMCSNISSSLSLSLPPPIPHPSGVSRDFLKGKLKSHSRQPSYLGW